MNKLKWLVLVVVLHSQHQCCVGRCMYGNTNDCSFKCHCANVTECSLAEVSCSAGCASGVLGYDWSGPACQIGNVALGKTTSFRGDVGGKDPSKVVNGELETNCANYLAYSSTTGQWSVDLGDTHRVYDIIIHFSNISCCGFDQLRNYFTVGVSSTYPPEDSTSDICISYITSNTPPPETVNISCPQNTLGRYVYFERLPNGFQQNVVYLCEVVVIGHKEIDCARCPTGVACSPVTGCEQCNGSYQPECVEVCDDGFYGVNCQQKCGHCSGVSQCDKISGACPSGCVTWWAPDLCQIYINESAPLNDLPTLVNSSPTTLSLQWKQMTLDEVIAAFYGYEIRYRRLNDNSEFKISSVHYRTGSSTNYGIIRNLQPNTFYEISIYPYREWSGIKDYGAAYGSVKGKTDCTEPDKPVIKSVTVIPIIVNVTDKIDVILEDLQSLSSGCDGLSKVWLNYKLEGYDKEYQREVNLTTETLSFQPEYGGRLRLWLTIENNVGLTSSSNIITVTVHGSVPPKTEDDFLTIIINVVAVVIFLAVVAALIVYCVRKRRRFSNDDQPNDGGEAEYEIDEIEVIDATGKVVNSLQPPRPPRSKIRHSLKSAGVSNGIYQNMELEPIRKVAVSEFANYFVRRTETDGLVEEFKTLPAADQSRCNTAKLPDNLKCNRFRNIYPYDESRVVLQTDDVVKGDFINASYITGYHGPKEYIATQGPCDTTVLDFWLMIWQEESNRIVMVANLEEKGKARCSKYWPQKSGQTMTIEPFTLTVDEKLVTADYTTTRITIRKNNEARTVYHFHFTSWPDKSKPSHGTAPLIAFYRRLHRFDIISKGPLVVHCSAGVGRTGTFIVLDILQNSVLNNNPIDVYNCVKSLREERMLMVQTKTQYIFIHEFLVDFIKSGITSYDTEGFEKTFKQLCDREVNGVSKLQWQFKILSEMKGETDNSEYKDGLLDHNKHKNRDLNLVPSDLDRPHLTGRIKDDYINAVYIDSFCTHDFYVATQMPLPDTVEDFWRMIYKLQACTIIMLNQFDNTDPTSKPYWPSKDDPKQTYGQVEVTLVKQSNNIDTIFTRDFLVKHNKSTNSQGRTVRQFQLLTWPNSARVPPDTDDILRLIDLSKEWQQQVNLQKSANTVVHCLTGGFQSGVFCGLSYLLDKMQLENVIDAFLAVRYVTRSRPQYFQTEEEYRFLYEMALVALKRNK